MVGMVLHLLQENSMVLVIGPPRSEKSILANQFLIDGIKKNEGVVYFITNNFPENVLGAVLSAFDKAAMTIIDCYTTYAGISKPTEEFVIRTSGPYALNEISIALTKAMKSMKPPIRIVFDSLSTLLLHNSPGEIEQFLEINIGKMKSKGATVLMMVEEGVHDPKQLSLLESLTDTTLHFNRGEKLLTLSSGGEERQIKYKLDKNEIMVDDA